MALTSGRNTVEVVDGRTLVLPVKANTKIFEGSIVALDSTGFAISAKKAAGLIAAGRSEEFVDNTGGADGAKLIKVRRGTFKYSNDSTAPVTEKDLLKDCYIVDDETVTITETGSSKAGKVIGLENGEVIVEIL